MYLLFEAYHMRVAELFEPDWLSEKKYTFGAKMMWGSHSGDYFERLYNQANIRSKLLAAG